MFALLLFDATTTSVNSDLVSITDDLIGTQVMELPAGSFTVYPWCVKRRSVYAHRLSLCACVSARQLQLGNKAN